MGGRYELGRVPFTDDPELFNGISAGITTLLTRVAGGMLGPGIGAVLGPGIGVMPELDIVPMPDLGPGIWA
jgi:hypothetical protein